MKFLKHTVFIATIAILAILTSNCTKQEIESKANGTFSLSFEDSGLKSDVPLTDIYVSIENSHGERIYDMKRLPLLSLSGVGYITENIELLEGSYVITAFMVASKNDIIYITPKEGSEKAYLVSRPLPIKFTVEPNRTTHIVPEVVKVDNCICPPEEFGYVTFSFTIVDEPHEIDLSGLWTGCFEMDIQCFTTPCPNEFCYEFEIYENDRNITITNGIDVFEGFTDGVNVYLNHVQQGDISLPVIGDSIILEIVDETFLSNRKFACKSCPIIEFSKGEKETICFSFAAEFAGEAEVIIYGDGEIIFDEMIIDGIYNIELSTKYKYYDFEVTGDYMYCQQTLKNYELEQYNCNTGKPLKFDCYYLDDYMLENGETINE